MVTVLLVVDSLLLFFAVSFTVKLPTALYLCLAVAPVVLTALNGQEALAAVNTHCYEGSPTCPDLIFLDVNMPLMNGFEFLAAYRELPPAQQSATVVVMLTTSLHPRDVERAQQLPVSGFLTKPLTEAKVMEIIQAHFAGMPAASTPVD